MGTVSSVFSLKMVRLGLGLSEGPCPVGLASTINNWFPPKESHGNRRLYRGHHVCADYRAAVGGVDCGHTGLAVGLFLLCDPGIVAAIARYLLVKSKPSESGFVSQSELEEINAGRDIHKNTVRENILIADRFTLLDKIIRVKNGAYRYGKGLFTSKISSVTAGLFYDG